MKKLVSLSLVILLLFSVFTINAGAISLNEGKTALEKQFEYGEGLKTNGYVLDYRYFSPIKGNDDTTKYPIVIWLHGHSHGQHDGYQIKSNNITNWASDEFQQRFSETGGAFILAIRAPEDIGISWDEDGLKIPLKSTVNDFIVKNSNNVNPSKIYIGGFSMGGMMTFEMAMEYPEMFAAIFPVCPYITFGSDDAEKFANVPVWLTSGKNDPLVSYTGRVLKDWNAIVSTTEVAESCRFSTLEKVCKPNGSLAPTAHYSWEAVTNDMFSSTNGAYPHMTTVTATGENVQLTYPNGLISWLDSFSSEYTLDDALANDNNNEGNINFFARLKGAFMVVYIFFRNLFRPITG